jgi:cysteinyl-tRNA synthetase
VYFSIERFPAYGRLSQLDKREIRTGASGRASSDEYAKEDARDFALWKAASPVDEQVGAAWDAPFGRGRPGWHLECSAMALDLLKMKGWGDVLDIHAGGVDLIFPHHEDEIAQSCAYTGQPDFARVWMHGEFLNVRGTKMSKRFGNITTARDLKNDGVDAGAIRLLMFQTHYRQKLDLTDEALDAAKEGAARLGNFAGRLSDAGTGTGAGGEAGKVAAEFRSEFTAALNDDLNAPRAVAALFTFVTAANRLLDQRSAGSALGDAFQWAAAIIDVLPAGKAIDPELKLWIEQKLEARREAKKKRDFTTADAIRAELAARGVLIEDTPAGTKWRLA